MVTFQSLTPEYERVNDVVTQELWVQGMNQLMEYFLGLINQHVIMLDPNAASHLHGNLRCFSNHD